jgi:hypothetical protein
MATIASLDVNLGMNKAGFDAGARGARTTLKSLANTANIATGIAASVNLVASLTRGAINTVKSLQSMLTATAENIDEQAKLADRLGFSTEALVGLEYHAELSGVSVESLTTGIEKLNANLGRAIQQGGTYARPFQLLGLDIAELARMEPHAVIELIADRINGLPTAAERAAVAMDIFGRSGIRMLNVLSSGSAGIRAMRAEAERMGITFSRLEASKVEEANDALADVGKVVEGIKQDVVIELAPTVTELAKELKEAGISGKEMGENIAEGLKAGVVVGAVLADTIRGVAVQHHTLRSAISSVGATLLDTATPRIGGRDTPGHIMAEELRKAADESAAARDRLLDTEWATPKALEALDRVNNALKDQADGANAAADAQDNLAGQLAQVSEEAQDLVDKWNQALQVRDILATSPLVAGLSEGRANDLAEAATEGASADQLGILRNQALALDAIEAREKARADSAERVRDLLQESISPLQEYQQLMADIWAASNRGELSVAAFSQAAAEARKRFEEAETKRREEMKSPLERRAEDRREELITPIETLRKELGDIREEFNAGLLTPDQATLADLKARADFLASREQPESVTDPRPAALERGTAAAFSASFGATPQPLNELLKVEKEILRLTRRIEAKTAEREIAAF